MHTNHKSLLFFPLSVERNSQYETCHCTEWNRTVVTGERKQDRNVMVEELIIDRQRCLSERKKSNGYMHKE